LKKNEVYETTVIGSIITHLKQPKIQRFVRFVRYCFITTCSVECYWHSFRHITTSPITIFSDFIFNIYNHHNRNCWHKIMTS